MPDIEVGDVVHLIAFDGEELDPLDESDLLVAKQELVWFTVRERENTKDCIIIDDDNWKPRAKE